MLISHKVNRYSKKLRKTKAASPSFLPGISRPIMDEQTGFICHPTGFPLDIKVLRLWERLPESSMEHENGGMGVIFTTERYIKPGSALEIEIPVRNGTESFRGRVVLVRNHGDSFEIGLLLCRRDDTHRIRMVEQFCHIETYLQEKKYLEGPYCINRDQAAKEWIAKYAASVPSL